MSNFKTILEKLIEAQRNDFKITFENGNSITTGFNGTLEDAKEYWKIGKKFNVGRGEKDSMQAVTKVEQL